MVRLASPGLMHLRRPVGRSAPAWGGVLALLLVAGSFAVLPDGRLEQLAEASGLARILPLTRPPLGNPVRLLLALVAGGLAASVSWSALYLLFGPGGPFHRGSAPDAEGAAHAPVRPSVRRADAHPDAPPRAPLTAAELGVPPPPSPAPVERDLPTDLDQPLAAFDPAAIPAVPREPARPVASIVRVACRMPAPAPLPPNDDPPPSIAALLDRLERGARRRPGA